ncbi:L-lysine 2-3-aminomutase [Penicillium cf. viridicatum]|uniref:L-lysine 2-3-aminomutase n=1 Tax=Penicillium cf. viridicatum TaxID=2972119 RepID=A0A9W9IWT6_9EURO|nr:L-lysine 2-3-aminomutase [Penicillium cf. viridicatum]
MYSIILFHSKSSTYDHRVWKTGLPVRSAVLKPHAGELVVGWVTTSESSLLKLLDRAEHAHAAPRRLWWYFYFSQDILVLE